MEIKSVINKYGEIEPFQAKRITYKIMEETELDKNEANKIQHNVIHALKNNYDESEISTSTIRSLIIQQLISKGYVEEEKKSRKLGMSVSDFEELVKFGCQDNANIGYNPEMVSKYSYDSIAKEYALLDMPKECSEAHINGYLHHHDLEFFNTRPNCMNYDLRFFARNGLMIDGKGVMGSVAKPAKSLEVLLNHLLQAFMAGATVFSGGQGYVNFNTLLAPFAKGMSYQKIKQAIQGFIYNCNMSLVCRGGQILFSSIALDLSCPEVLKDEPAVSFGGVTNGTYKDYQDEADMIFRAVLEVSDEKDGQGRWHRFPNILFNLRKGDLDEYTGNCKLLHELGANNPTLYYVNCQEIERTVMGCLDGSEGIWCRIDGKLNYKTFFELDNLFNADYGITPIKNMEVLTIDNNRQIIWHSVKNFIKNKNQQMYKISLLGNKSFICDENHSMITFKGLNKKPILECVGSNLIDVNCKNTNVDFDIDFNAILMGFWLGDGAKNINYSRISVSKEDKKDYLISVFNKINMNYDFNHKTRPIDNNHINPNIYEFKFDKLYLDNFDLNDINVCAGLLSGMLSSDGYIRKTGKIKKSLGAEFVSTNQEISNLFKYCCFMLGLKFSSTIKSKQSKNHSDFERIYISCNKSTIHTLKQLYLRKSQMDIVDEFNEDDFRDIKQYKGQRVKSIEKLDKRDSFCLEVNDRMIMGSDFILTGQCRTALPMNFTGDYAKDCCNTGNFMYTTINLPLIAYESKSLEDFYNLLDYYCEIIYTTLKYRRSEVEKIIYDLHMSDFLIQKDVETGEPLYDLDRCTYTIGFCGLNEAQIELNGLSLGDDDELGYEIVKFINAKKDEFKERDGMRWSVIGSPAESTSFRFGKINKQKYDDITVQGTDDSPYLTNSSHIPVNDECNIVRHIENSDKFHPLTEGGNLLHIWLGEVWSGAEALWKLNQKILNTNTKFWAYSKVFTYCQECQYTINDNISKCPICGSEDLIVYDRITGYYLPVLSRNENGETKQWNDGKLQEFKDRYRHELNS